MKDVNKDKLQARENFSDLEEDKEKGDRKYIYIFFYFFLRRVNGEKRDRVDE